MSKCLCGKTYRKGAMVLTLESRRPVMRRVCPDCAAEAIPILSKQGGTVVKEVRSDVVQKTLRQLRTQLAAARAQKGVYGDRRDGEQVSYFEGRMSGLESAIELLKRESGEA